MELFKDFLAFVKKEKKISIVILICFVIIIVFFICNNTIIKYKEDGLYGFKHIIGKEVTPPIYFEARDFKKGRAAVKNNAGKWGFIDKTGEEVIPCKYVKVDDFGYGMYMTKVYLEKSDGYKCGYIDKNGDIVVPIIYVDVEVDRSAGLAWGMKDGVHQDGGFYDIQEYCSY